MTDALGGDAPARRATTPTAERRVVVAIMVAAVLIALEIAIGARLLGQNRASGRLAVVDADGRLSTINSRGGSVTSYDLPGTVLRFPAWSPDGTRIAAIGEAGDGAGVYVFDGRAGGGERTPASIYQSGDRPPFYLYWTPDSRQLTFLTTEPTGLALRLAPADGATPDVVLRTGAPMYWTWLDADHLELHSGVAEPDVFLGEIELGGLATANEVASPGIFRAPAVSADGVRRAHIVAVTGVATGEPPARLVVEGRDGSARQEVPVFGVAAMAFDPTGSQLAFVAADEASDRAAPFPLGPLRIVDAATGSVRTVLDGEVLAFFWAPDGRTIASLRVDVSGGLEASSSPALLAQAEGFLLRLGFTDPATGATRAERAVRVSELFASLVLPFFDQYALSHRFWSPDSRSIVLPLVEAGAAGLYVVGADGGEPVRVSDGTIGFWSP